MIFRRGRIKRKKHHAVGEKNQKYNKIRREREKSTPLTHKYKIPHFPGLIQALQ